MNIEAVFGKARLLRALTSLDRVEFARLEEGMDKLLAERAGGASARWLATPAGVWRGWAGQAAHDAGAALVPALLLQVLPLAGGARLSLWHEPAPGVRVDQEAHAFGQRGARTGVALARPPPADLETL